VLTPLLLDVPASWRRSPTGLTSDVESGMLGQRAKLDFMIITKQKVLLNSQKLILKIYTKYLMYD
jgi:hypothetical protein